MMTWQVTCTRSSHWRSSVKKGVLKIFTKSAVKHLCRSLFLNKAASLRSAAILKRGSEAGVFL